MSSPSSWRSTRRSCRELRRVLTLVDPKDKRTARALKEYKSAAAQLQRPLELDIREATTAEDLERVFRSLRPGEVDGAFLLSNNLRQNHSALSDQARQACAATDPGEPQGMGRAGSALLVRHRPRAARASRRTLRRQHPQRHVSGRPARRGDPENRVRDQSQGGQQARNQGAAGDDSSRGRGLPLGERDMEAPVRPHRRLKWKYTGVVVALVAAAVVSLGLTELYFSYQDTKRALTRRRARQGVHGRHLDRAAHAGARPGARVGRPADHRQRCRGPRRAQAGLQPAPRAEGARQPAPVPRRGGKGAGS